MNILEFLFGQTLANSLKSRDEIAIEKIYANYDYKKCSRKKFKLLWLQLAEILGVRPTLLRLSDRFTVELRSRDGLFGVNSDMDTLVEWAEHIAKKSGREIDFSKLRTLKDLIDELVIQK